MTRAHFKFLTGDVNWQDHGGTFVRKVGVERYHLMRIDNWITDIGEAEAEELGAVYNVSLSEVDLTETTDAQCLDAIQSYDWDLDDIAEMQEGMSNPDLVWVQVLFEAGHKAPLWQDDGNNYRKLMQAARAESSRLDDRIAHRAAMNKPVNMIGSTAREFRQNDIASAMARGVSESSPEAKLLAKMSGVPTEIIEAVEAHGPFRGITARIKLGKIPSDDPIAYQAGYMTALSGAGLDGPRLDLAEAYIDGYKHGVDVKAGRQPRPEFHA